MPSGCPQASPCNFPTYFGQRRGQSVLLILQADFLAGGLAECPVTVIRLIVRSVLAPRPDVKASWYLGCYLGGWILSAILCSTRWHRCTCPPGKMRAREYRRHILNSRSFLVGSQGLLPPDNFRS